jgi:1A family penicillin-binding protein
MGLRVAERWAHLRDVSREARRRHPRLVPALVVAFLLVALVTTGGGAWFLLSLRHGLPNEDAIQRIGEMDQATAVFDASDRLAFTIYKEQRMEVPLSEMSPNLVHAILDIEDQRFYQHRGFDLVRMASATLANVRHRRAAQGGSTITQQLARQSFLRPDKTLHRKFQELILAARLEHFYTKAHILELYLNKVYFGDGLYGVEAASRGYFGKHASELKVEEAALLAGLVKSPSNYAPTVNMERAVARRNIVLQAMLEAGHVDRAVVKAARGKRVPLHDTLREPESHGQYFKEQVRRELIDRFGWEDVYQGGLRVYTTLDMQMQIAAESAIAEHLKMLDDRRRAIAARRTALQARRETKTGPVPVATSGTTVDRNPLQAALVALDPETGHVRAMVGGRDFDVSNFNRAVQAKRQPGSAFKPFVYAAALESGFTPASVIDRLDDPIIIGRAAWTPEDEHSSGSSMTIRTALRTSSNRAAVRMLQEIGIGRAVQEARELGIGDLPSVPSLALGSGEVTLQSMTAAYGAFANHGMLNKPVLIRRVEDRDGVLLYQSHEPPARAISDVTAFLMSTMLADVINAGTGARARALGFRLPAAGKTGTTNDFNDAWFVGYTPNLVAGVWVGFDQPRTILPRGFAADVAVPLWANFMKAATKDAKPEWLTPPAGVVAVQVCRISGQLPGDGCSDVDVVDRNGDLERRSMIYTEYFARGTEPTTLCTLHSVRTAPGIVGVVAGGETPVRHDDTHHADMVVGPVTTTVPPPPPIAPVATTGVHPETTTATEKKRGFWSRVFRRGGDSKTQKPERPDDDPDKPRKRPQ